jgi:hypothetical protein
MAPFVEPHQEAVGLHFHLAARLDELAVHLFRGGLVQAVQLTRQPAIATVGQHCQRRIPIDVQSHLADQAVQVKEVDTGPKAILDRVAPGLTDDQGSRRFRQVVGDEQWGLLPSQAIDGQLADLPLVSRQSNHLVHQADLLMTSFGRVDHGTLPRLWRQPTETTDHGGVTSSDRDEMNRV